MANNDYEKAKENCWCDWTFNNIPTGASLQEVGEAKRLFNFTFNRAYQLGKAHTQPANGLVNELANERLQVAAMAMLGLLSSNIWMKGIMREADPNSHSVDDSEVIPLLANRAIAIADALLNELNKDNNG